MKKYKQEYLTPTHVRILPILPVCPYWSPLSSVPVHSSIVSLYKFLFLYYSEMDFDLYVKMFVLFHILVFFSRNFKQVYIKPLYLSPKDKISL